MRSRFNQFRFDEQALGRFNPNDRSRANMNFRIHRLCHSANRLVFGGFCWFACLFCSPLIAEEVLFDRDIRPILADHCFACHGPDSDQRKADLRLDTREGLLGDANAPGPFVPNEPEKSQALTRILAEDPADRMPPPKAKRPLSQDQIRLLQQWVNEGANWQRHWAFEPIVKPAAPVFGTSSWGRHPIDLFIHKRQTEASLTPEPEASREELIRRLTLDLHGLPPEPEAIDAFVEDPAPDAYERLLDRLLSSPRYGERMVWNWLDAARYADSNGYQGDRERTMWPWRDWAISAFNRNLPFDQFTVQQIAGDLLHEATDEQILATGFNRNHMINGEGGRIAEENRIDYVMDMSETVGTVWLGLTLNCCRCHDHKYDPLSQRDYYGFFAFFNQTPVNGGGGDPQTPPVLTAPTDRQKIQAELAAQARTEQETVLRLWEREHWANGNEEILAILQTDIRGRNDQQLDRLIEFAAASRPDYTQRLEELKNQRKRLADLEKSFAKVMVMKDRDSPRETFLLNRGLYDSPEDPVAAATPTALPPLPGSAPRNRLGLAHWLTSPTHPLTARVFVNRQWSLFFGQGLVTTPEDFGTQGKRPSHPELLDWLASDFIASGWNVKRLHRQMLSSAAYRQSSRTSPEKRQSDPDNRWLARGPRYRLPSWMIRDQALSASGLLVDEIGGPPVNPYQPLGVWADFTFNNKRYQAGKGAALYRRSVYTFWRRIIGPTMFFDSAKRQTCTVKSSRTNTPMHALATLNDPTYVEAARILAQQAIQAETSPEKRLELAFRRAVGRYPRPVETGIMLQRLKIAGDYFAQDPKAAEALLSEGDSPSDPALDPIRHAAYATVCGLILNLDEFLSKQ